MSDADTIRKLVDEAVSKGHERMIIVLFGRARRSHTRREERVRVAPGLLGCLVGETDLPDGTVEMTADVVVSDAQKWLKRREVAQ